MEGRENKADRWKTDESLLSLQMLREYCEKNSEFR
jgi:hypothetical protein